MASVSRREVLKLASASMLGAVPVASLGQVGGGRGTVPVWECFEVELPGPAAGNPFLDVSLSAVFRQGYREVEVAGFYDGDGKYKVRFMPDAEGAWTYRTVSSAKQLDGQAGGFTIVAALDGVHGPVRVAGAHHFGYADGAPYFPFGTTCYAWVHQSEALQEQTLATLKSAPFNKIRMCVFPKHYEYNHNEPPFYPFPRDAAGKNDFSRFNPEFFRHLERRIGDLRALGIEADLILFHPYDRWGYSTMTAEEDDRYLRYVLARLSAYRNIWWSMANEYDLMKAKTTVDFDRLFHVVERGDSFGHLRSIHYSNAAYDYSKPWVTHGCLQTANFGAAARYLQDWRKPVVFDEVQYEGNLNKRWGNLSGDEMTRRFWLGMMAGCYVTHGETLLDPKAAMDEEATPTLWWSHGGTLRGTSPAQIAFLRKLVEESAVSNGPVKVRPGLEAQADGYYSNAAAYSMDGKRAETVIYFMDYHQPVWYEFPLPEGTFRAEAIDPMAMEIVALDGTFSGKAKIKLAGRPYRAMRFRAVN
jgi:Domain of unknown function (DUF5060)/Protein of unknown function (DUF4038)/Domain of unknown function (DUF5605)